MLIPAFIYIYVTGGIMNKKAKNELMMLIFGLVIFTIGTASFLSKARVTSDFLSMKGIWTWWKVLAVFVPIIAGIIMLLVKPHHVVSKIFAAAGAIIVVAVLFFDTVIIIEKDISALEWVLYFVFMIGGALVSLWVLFIKGRKNR